VNGQDITYVSLPIAATLIGVSERTMHGFVAGLIGSGPAVPVTEVRGESAVRLDDLNDWLATHVAISKLRTDRQETTE